ncbi:hypothetical protein SAMN04515678_1112 [Roseivivax sediminis]|uniref:Uncharacterized protein n=1 Tax=Roseivivax sediminis TaxID=936889 RepID=A0A1I2BDI2_9RHOB|nr:hypothetical protein SAMN04515678_1112 [Roseivivax sediminis]
MFVEIITVAIIGFALVSGGAIVWDHARKPR